MKAGKLKSSSNLISTNDKAQSLTQIHKDYFPTILYNPAIAHPNSYSKQISLPSYSSCLSKYIHLATALATTLSHTVFYSTHKDGNKDTQVF